MARNPASRAELDAAKERARAGLPPRNDLERLAVNLVAGEAKVAKMQKREAARIAKHRPEDRLFVQVTSKTAFGRVKTALGRTPGLYGRMNERKGAPLRFFIRRDEAPKLRGIKVKPARWSDQYFEKGAGTKSKKNPKKTSGVSLRSIMSKALK